MADQRRAGTDETARRYKEARGLTRLAARVASLEGRVDVIETQNVECSAERSQLIANTDEILAVVKGAKSGKLPQEVSDLISKIFNF